MWNQNPIFNLLKYTWQYSAGNRRNVVVFVVLSFLANILQLFEPVVISRAFEQVQLSPDDPGLLSHVIENLALLVAITLGFWILHGTSRNMEMRNAFIVRKNYKMAMFNRILEFPVGWHKDHHSGDTIDKINKASESIYDFSFKIFIIATSLVRLFGGVIALWFFDRLASVVALVFSIFVLFIVARFDKVIRRGLIKIFKAENFLASAIHDYVSNIITIITLRLKQRVSSEIERRSMLAFSIFKRNIMLGEIKWFFASMSLAVMISALLIANAHRSYTTTGIIMLGTLFALYLYLRRIGDTFFEFAMRYSEMVRHDTALKAADELFLNHHNPVLSGENDQQLHWTKAEIKNLSFRYPDEDNPEHKRIHLNGISFSFEKGQKIALIGESGSGKSTLLALLRGLYQPDSINVRLDDKEQPNGLAAIYDQVTLIPQDPEIFNSTIEDNITMETKVSDSDLKDAIELAQFKSVLERLPKGLQTNVLEKGVSLSGGEKQRLALARGVLAARNSDFIFMDEPTSSVDTQNEYLIYHNIFRKFSGRTIISSIHRLHLLKMFDLIYYFKNGEVAAYGTLNEISNNPQVKDLLEKYQVSPGLNQK